jgi:hypothetical protein
MTAPRRLITVASLVAMLVLACGSATPVPTRPPVATPPAAGGPADLQVPTAPWKTDFSISSVHLGTITAGGPPRDGIPSIDAPRFESIAAARSWLPDDAPVIALEVAGTARAYPLAILVWHEIVNDTLGGVPIIVTFCPLCHAALVFERTVDGQVLDFGATGNLRYLDLVMYDRATETWWQQATGEAIVGTLTGSQLTFLPAQIVSLADFALAHPDGDVLSRDTGASRRYGQNPYPGLDRADPRPFSYVNQVDGRLEAKERVVTVELDGSALAIAYADLARERVIEIDRRSTSIVVVWKPGTRSALDLDRMDASRDVGATGVFSPVLAGRRLTFTPGPGPEVAMIDRQTGSGWSVTGLALTGPLTGSRLDPVIHADPFWFSWAGFRPDTQIWQP